MSENLTIRAYTDADEPAVLPLLRQLQTFELPMNPHLMPPEDIGPLYMATAKKHCAAQDGVVLLAERHGELLGYVCLLCKCDEDGTDQEIAYSFAYVADLVVAEGARGQGIGTLLLERCEAIAKAKGRSIFRIGVLAQNFSAQRLYERFGFQKRHMTLEKILA